MSERPRGKRGRKENPPRQDTEEERDLKASAEYQARQRKVSKIEMYPTPEVPVAVREHEAEVLEGIEEKVDKRIATESASESVPYNEEATVKEMLEHSMALGLSRPPPELTKIYGDTVPAEKLEMYGKLKGKIKREGYLAKLAADEAEKKKRRAPRKAAAEPPVGDADVDTSGVQAVQDAMKENRRRAEEELNAEVEPSEADKPIAPLTPMPSEFHEQKPKADFIAEQLAATVNKKSGAEAKSPQIGGDFLSQDEIDRLLGSFNQQPGTAEPSHTELSEAEKNARREQMQGLFEQIREIEKQQDPLYEKSDDTITPEDMELRRELGNRKYDLRRQLDALVSETFPHEEEPLASESIPEGPGAEQGLTDLIARIQARKDEIPILFGARNLDEYVQVRESDLRHTALNRKNREVEERLKSLQPKDAEKEKDAETVSFEEVKDILAKQLEGKAEIKQLDITETPEGLQIRAELHHGMAKKIELTGSLVNDGNTIAVQGLDVKAQRFEGRVRSEIEKGLSGFGSAIKTYLEKQYGKPVSGMQVGASGLTVEFEPPAPAADVDSAGRKDPMFGAEPTEPKDLAPKSEDTRAGWYAQLREAVGKVVDKTKEKVEWWKSAEAGLIRRNAELDEQLEKISKVERGFRWVGENYNKLPFKYKLAIGVALGLGAVATAGTLAVAFPLLGIGAQRAAGLATMYMKFEKKSHNEKWGKEKAMLKAGVYTALMGLAIKEAVEYASGTELAHAAQAKVEGWLGTMLGHGTAVVSEVAGPPTGAEQEAWTNAGHPPHDTTNFAPRTTEPSAPETPQPAPAAGAGVLPVAPEAGEAAATVPVAPEMPSVITTPGKGYEFMMKRLWEQLQEKGLDASHYAEDSDIHKLLTATPENIDTIVHQIAADSQHGFFNPDGTSVRIDPGSQMTIGTDGNIHLNEVVQAPANAPVTPVYQPGIAAEQAVVPQEVPQDFLGPVSEDAFTQAQAEELSKRIINDAISPERIMVLPTNEVPLGQETIAIPGPVQTVDLTEGQDLASQQSAEVTPSVDETQPSAPVVERGFISNQFGLNVPVAEAHIYADPGAAHTLVFGGSVAEQAEAIQKHLLSNPDTVVYGTDNTSTYLIPFHLVDGKMEAGPPMRTSGILGFFSTWMKAPGPDDLEKLIK